MWPTGSFLIIIMSPAVGGSRVQSCGTTAGLPPAALPAVVAPTTHLDFKIWLDRPENFTGVENLHNARSELPSANRLRVHTFNF